MPSHYATCLTTWNFVETQVTRDMLNNHATCLLQEALHEVEKQVLLFTMICCNTYLSNLLHNISVEKPTKPFYLKTDPSIC